MENVNAKTVVQPQNSPGGNWRSRMRINVRQYTMIIALLLV